MTAPPAQPDPDWLHGDEPLRPVVRRLLAEWDRSSVAGVQSSGPGYAADIWQAVCRGTWPQVRNAEDVRVLGEELGFACCPLPLGNGLVMPWFGLRPPGAGEAVRADMAAGRRWSLAVDEGGGPSAWRRDVRASWRGDGSLALYGTVRHVRYADSSEGFVVPAMADGSPPQLLLATVRAGSAGLSVTPHVTIAADRMSDVAFDGVRLGRTEVLGTDPGRARAALERAFAYGTVARAAELTGLAAGLLGLTTGRLRTRRAFGQPLAALQSVQLRSADAYLALLAVREATREAAAALDGLSGSSPQALPADVLLTLSECHVVATQAALEVARCAHQLCGGWGYLAEAGLHHYTRAMKSAESRLGSTREHRAAIAGVLAGS